MAWHELAVAGCLVLIIEGVLPFLNPARWRSMVAVLAQISDQQIRIIGLFSMLLGVILLYWIK